MSRFVYNGVFEMMPLHKAWFVARAAIPAVVLVMSAQLVLSQAPPPPPPGVVVQMPDKADPSVKVPQFDVISVKPSKDNQTRVQFMVDGVRGESVTARFMLLEGFGGVSQNQVVGEPSWATTEGFDIEAKVAAEDLPALAKLTFDQRRSMFQQILAERFKMVAHHETRELPVYELTISKGGSRLRESAREDPGSGTPRRNFVMFGPDKVTATNSSLSALTMPLSRQLGRIVVDKTGLTGRYDFTLEWTPEGAASPPGGSMTDRGGQDIFGAIQEQLGLKLLPGKGSVDVIVIDHIERPSAN